MRPMRCLRWRRPPPLLPHLLQLSALLSTMHTAHECTLLQCIRLCCYATEYAAGGVSGTTGSDTVVQGDRCHLQAQCTRLLALRFARLCGAYKNRWLTNACSRQGTVDTCTPSPSSSLTTLCAPMSSITSGRHKNKSAAALVRPSRIRYLTRN